MASSSFNMETVAGLIPIFVSKTVTFPAHSVTSVDLSEFIPQGKSIRAIGTVKVGNNPLPYFSGDNSVAFIKEFTSNTLIFDNRVSAWTNNLLTAIIYVS